MEPAEKEKKKKRGRLKVKRRRSSGGDGRGVERLSDLQIKTRRRWRRERGGREWAGGERGRGGGGERPGKKDGEMILVGDWQSAAVVDSSTKGR